MVILKHSYFFYKYAYWIAAGLGSILNLAFSPFNIPIVIPISFSILLLLIEKATKTLKAFFIGFFFGLGHFLCGLYWISYALTIDLHIFCWLIPIVVILLPSILSIFTGLVALITYRYIICCKRLALEGKYIRVLLPFIFSCLWIGAEILRGYAILPFPWNFIGYATNYSISLMQVASVIGVHGLGFITVFVGTIWYSRNKSLILVTLTALCILHIWGYYRYTTPEVRNTSSDITSLPMIRIVQPNIVLPPLDTQSKLAALSQTLQLTEREGLGNMNYIFWPESAFPFTISTSAKSIPELRGILPSGAYLITGADTYDQIANRIFNSIVVVNDAGEIVAKYSKKVLVPFGEYVPWSNFLHFIPTVVTLGDFGYTEGHGESRYLETKQLNIAPYICYEAILAPFFFKNFNRENGSNIDVILNITNDAWFKNSIGPHQHFAMARMRTIELGLPMVRAANTGISAIIDAYGKIQATLPIYKSGIIDARLHINALYTVYSSYYHVIFYIIGSLCAGIFLLLLALESWKNGASKNCL